MDEYEDYQDEGFYQEPDDRPRQSRTGLDPDHEWMLDLDPDSDYFDYED